MEVGSLGRMKKSIYSLIAISIAMVISGCAGGQVTKEDIENLKQSCLKKNYIFTENECLETYVSKGNVKNKVIVILTGRSGNHGNPMLKTPKMANYFNEKTNITTYVFAYPGYSKSTSNNYGRHNYKTMYQGDKNYLKLIATALKEIKIKENANELYVFGHSIGGIIASSIAGQYPNLINKIVTYGTPYNMKEWYNDKDWGQYSGIQPIDAVNKIQNTSFLLTVGSNDKNAIPKYAKEYNDLLRKNNILSDVYIFDNLGHNIKGSTKIMKKATDFFNK